MKLEIENLTKTYGKIIALDNVSTTLEEGIYGLLGPNGAGKSTLINLITDNIRREKGSIYLEGTEILKLGSKYREILGYMPQEQGYYEEFTALEFLIYIGKLKGLKGRKAYERTIDLLKKVNMYEYRNKKIGEFSGGMKQRIMLAQSLLNSPKILILDEPTAGVDPQERIRIRNMISEIAKDRIVILATHIISDVEAIAKELILIKDGKIIKKGSPNKLLRNMEAKVYEIKIAEDDLEGIRQKYVISNLKSTADGLVVKVVSEEIIESAEILTCEAGLEDLYLYYFNE